MLCRAVKCRAMKCRAVKCRAASNRVLLVAFWSAAVVAYIHSWQANPTCSGIRCYLQEMVYSGLSATWHLRRVLVANYRRQTRGWPRFTQHTFTSAPERSLHYLVWIVQARLFYFLRPDYCFSWTTNVSFIHVWVTWCVICI